MKWSFSLTATITASTHPGLWLHLRQFYDPQGRTFRISWFAKGVPQKTWPSQIDCQ